MEKLIREIMGKAFKISKTTNTDVFVEYHGHVNVISITIFKDGWKKGKEALYSKDIYMNRYSNEEVEKILKEVLAELQEIEKGE